jgi:hypothetical protein
LCFSLTSLFELHYFLPLIRPTPFSARGREALCAEQTERERLTREFDAFAAAETLRLGRLAMPLIIAAADASALGSGETGSENGALAAGEKASEKGVSTAGERTRGEKAALASVPIGAALIAAAIPDLAQRIAAADEAQRRQTEAASRVWISAVSLSLSCPTRVSDFCLRFFSVRQIFLSLDFFVLDDICLLSLIFHISRSDGPPREQVAPITSPSAWLAAPLPVEALASLAAASSQSSASSVSSAPLLSAFVPLGPRLRFARLTPALWAAVAEFLPLREGATTLACLARDFHTTSSSTDPSSSTSTASVPLLLSHRRAAELRGFADADRLAACLRHLSAHCPRLSEVCVR